MAGKRPIEQGTFVTPRALYRNNVTAGGETDPTADIPELDTTEAPNTNVGLGQSDINMYGQNAQIDLAIYVSGFSSVVLELWLKAPLELKQLSDVAPVVPDLPGTTQDWVFVSTITVTRSQLWIVKDIPPGIYKVLVKTVAGSGFVTLMEGHAA